ncbi:MAG: gamma-glutamylcyclotransferase [Rhodobacteraceae bacterium]|nr:gamma-glutamylcyclotransferase [Paracoccaceae bacterium]
MWVFGYGSLIWDPGFSVAERQIAQLRGWHRRFCMWSIHHRGTVAAPGLVLALDRADGDEDAVCAGVAFRVEPGAEDATLAYLRERELVSAAYLETHLPVTLARGEQVMALVYVINRDHDQYCGRLSDEEQARIIATAQGGRGPNRDYLFATARHLAELGIADDALSRLAQRVAQIEGVFSAR